MNNNEEKFFSYLHGQMNYEEKKEFELELIKSADLNNEFNDYKKLMNIVSETKNINLSKDYSESIITEFRNRLEIKSTKKIIPNFRYAIASVIIIVVGYFSFSVLNKETPDEINSILKEYSYDELNSITKNYDFSIGLEKNFNDNDISKIDSIYKQNVSVNLIESIGSKATDYIFVNNNVADVNEYISDNDVDLIYSQLIDKQIL
ncbi:MAG TPA: hypothetical protein DHV28_18410 [Ignavibacteriales bacterium]|nr:hypothetical protein [Ignavibacteriales bacterium]